MERSQPQTWGSGRPLTFQESQQRQQFFTATASVVQLPPVSPMHHHYPRHLQQPNQLYNEQDAAVSSAAVHSADSRDFSGLTPRGGTPFASARAASHEVMRHMGSSTSHQSVPAEQAWDIASSNADRLMAKLSHLKNTIRSVRERTGETDAPMPSDSNAQPPFSQQHWDKEHQLVDAGNYSEPRPPPPSPPLNDAAQVSDAHTDVVNQQQPNRVLPSPPEVFSPSSLLRSNSAMIANSHYPPVYHTIASPRAPPRYLDGRDTPRGVRGGVAAGGGVQQLSPEPLEVDPNAKRYISSLEERVSALTFENNKLKSANESLQMSIKSLEDNGHVSDSLMLQQQQQQLKTALEQRVSSLQRQSELVEVFDAACVKPLELIGDGSFGEVRKGYVTLPVAVKTARRQGQGGGGGAEAARDASLKQEEQIFREASLQGSLRHPGVVRSLGICISEGGQVALVTELVQGRSLEDILHSKKIALSMLETISIAIQLADALAYLHHRSVVHRDVKPGNILVSSDMVVKLCDFGLACR